MTDNKEWYTLQEIAIQLSVPLYRVRNAVGTLSTGGSIITRNKPTDRRVLEIHKDSLPILRKALLGE